MAAVEISIHAPTRGATDKAMMTVNGITIFQSTLPREERLTEEAEKQILDDFNPRSHERSDLPFIRFFNLCFISIHAPTRGATLSFSHFLSVLLFQSTLPREERRKTGLFFYAHFSISIHAPTRGATIFCVTANPLIKFQSTLPREERQL